MANLEIIELPPGWKMEDLISITKHGKGVRVALSPWLVKRMLGGEWPEFHGFGFGAVHSYLLEKDGTLIPMDMGCGGEPVPGPSFKLSMIDDVFSDTPKLIPL